MLAKITAILLKDKPVTLPERRFSDRYEGAELKLEVRPLGLFGRPKDAHPALVSNFAVGGVAIVTPLRLKIGQKIQITLLSEHHNLKSVPAEVIRYDGKQVDFRYGLKFNLASLPQTANQNVLFILQQMELSLKNALILN